MVGHAAGVNRPLSPACLQGWLPALILWPRIGCNPLHDTLRDHCQEQRFPLRRYSAPVMVSQKETVAVAEGSNCY